MKIYRVVQEVPDKDDPKVTKHMESHVLAESLVDVAKEYERDEPELEFILIAIIETGVCVRTIERPKDAYRNLFEDDPESD